MNIYGAAILTCLAGAFLLLLWLSPVGAWVKFVGIRFGWHLCRKTHEGCCTTCDGTGVDRTAYETGGRCWDCYGSGHTHP